MNKSRRRLHMFHGILIGTLVWGIMLLYLNTVLATSFLVSVKNSEIAAPIVEEKIELIDEIALKQEEMRNTTVLITTINGRGSGTIIDRIDTDTNGLFEYRVLTNSHVTYLRFTKLLRGVNSITGTTRIVHVDNGCKIVVFDYHSGNRQIYDSKIIDEDPELDIAILLFLSDKKLSVARIANDDMLRQVRVFDEVFVIGCQLGQAPSPTTGIISRIMNGKHKEKEWIIYGCTSQLTPGSSGGGLYKRYNNHYRLIGIPFRIAVTYGGQLVPHLAHAISISNAKDFIDKNSVCKNK